MTKTIWMVSGNKGGVGKSLFCLALASALEMNDAKFAILDGDGRIGDVHAIFLRKCPSRWVDFRELRPESHNCQLDEVYESIVYQLLESSPNLIINTPDGADSLLMKWFDVTLSHSETNNWQFKFIYLLSDRPDGLELIPDLIKRFSAFYPIRNLHFGPSGLFSAFNNDYRCLFNKTIDMPSLRGNEVRLLLDNKIYPAEALQLLNKNNKYFLHSLTRARIKKWQEDVLELLTDIIVGQDQSNIKLASANAKLLDI